MSRRRQPRRAGAAVRDVLEVAGPRTLLAEVQSAWREAGGEAIAREARPVAEREGVVTVACRSATWAAELDLMQGELLERLNRRAQGRVAGLRFTADLARHEDG